MNRCLVVIHTVLVCRDSFLDLVVRLWLRLLNRLWLRLLNGLWLRLLNGLWLRLLNGLWLRLLNDNVKLGAHGAEGKDQKLRGECILALRGNRVLYSDGILES